MDLDRVGQGVELFWLPPVRAWGAPRQRWQTRQRRGRAPRANAGRAVRYRSSRAWSVVEMRAIHRALGRKAPFPTTGT